MRLRELKKLVAQLVASGGGGGFIPDWQGQVGHELFPFSGDTTFEPLLEGTRLIRVSVGVVMHPAAPGASGVSIALRHSVGGVLSDMDLCNMSCDFEGEVWLSGIIGDGDFFQVWAMATGDASDVTYLEPTRVDEIPAL